MKLITIKRGLFPKYVLKEDYTFVTSEKRPRSFVINEGFIYDGATFGSFLFWRKSMHKEPATLAHDWLFYNLGDVGAVYVDTGAESPKITKAEADDIFLQEARRRVNIQDWRTKVASAAFKTVGELMWHKRKLTWLVLRRK